MPSCEFGNELNLVSDGKRLLLRLGEKTIVIHNFLVTSANVNVSLDNHSFGEIVVQGLKETHITIEMVGGEVCLTDENQLDYKFAMGMTVRELLQTVNEKLNKRKDNDDGKEKEGKR